MVSCLLLHPEFRVFPAGLSPGEPGAAARSHGKETAKGPGGRRAPGPGAMSARS